MAGVSGVKFFLTAQIMIKIIPVFLIAQMVMQVMVYSQTIPQKFFDALIYSKPEITDYINTDELARSQRLGITYIDVKHKFLIGSDIPESIKEGIISGKYTYKVSEVQLEESYTEATITVPEVNFSRIYYFNEGFVSGSAYHTRLWTVRQSKYFNFRIEEPVYFNEYCIKRLDGYVDMMADTLGFSDSEKRILEKEKIGYLLCLDETGVEKITGYKARGIAMLGSDEVVTSYQTHFHEVAHIIINYKLKKLGLYTLPFFMEGFAVATGGRGGIAPGVVTHIGCYLQKTGFLTYDSILTNEQFRNLDGSMTYPVAGLYNSFLLSMLGGRKYLELYKSVNGSLGFIEKLDISSIDLPTHGKFEEFISNYRNVKIMYVDENNKLKAENYNPDLNGSFTRDGDYIKFFTGSVYTPVINGIQKDKDYISRKYRELNNNTEYNGMKYIIAAGEESVSIYNLFNDELIFSFNRGFSTDDILIPKQEGFYVFFIKQDLFENDFSR